MRTPDRETTRAYVESDPVAFGVRIAVVRPHHVLRWQPVEVTVRTEDMQHSVPDDDVWLRIPDEDARALYEGLADYFGHGGHDTRALRRDYDAERGRVDRFIAYLTDGRPS